MYNNDAQKYRQQQILNASPAQQIVMLYDAAIQNCQKAKMAIGEGRIQDRHNANRKAMEVVGYLMEILDMDKGGEVAKRLYMIYNGLIKKLMNVDFKNDAAICDEVIDNLRVLRESWVEIAKQGTPATTAAGPDGVKKLDRTADGTPAGVSAVA